MVDSRDTNLSRKLAFRHEEFLNLPGTSGKAVSRERIDRCPLPKKVDGQGGYCRLSSKESLNCSRIWWFAVRFGWLLIDYGRATDMHALQQPLESNPQCATIWVRITF
jgi:hypothetical protein